MLCRDVKPIHTAATPAAAENARDEIPDTPGTRALPWASGLPCNASHRQGPDTMGNQVEARVGRIRLSPLTDQAGRQGTTIENHQLHT